jgi:hypothetical protein
MDSRTYLVRQQQRPDPSRIRERQPNGGAAAAVSNDRHVGCTAVVEHCAQIAKLREPRTRSSWREVCPVRGKGRDNPPVNLLRVSRVALPDHLYRTVQTFANDRARPRARPCRCGLERRARAWEPETAQLREGPRSCPIVHACQV